AGRGGPRDRHLEAAPGGAAGAVGARVLVCEGLRGALQARAPEPGPPGRLRRGLHGRVRSEQPGQRSAPAAALHTGAVPAPHLRAGALGRVRPDRAQGHGLGHARAADLQRGARHLLEVRIEPAGRDEFLALMRETYGSAMSEAEFDWWFDR